jgi:hypothetical protein
VPSTAVDSMGLGGLLGAAGLGQQAAAGRMGAVTGGAKRTSAADEG